MAGTVLRFASLKDGFQALGNMWRNGWRTQRRAREKLCSSYDKVVISQISQAFYVINSYVCLTQFY